MIIFLTLMAMNLEWVARVIDVEGEFLQGKFVDEEELYIRVPNGFKECYDYDVVLRPNVPIYGMKQAAHYFYVVLVKAVT